MIKLDTYTKFTFLLKRRLHEPIVGHYFALKLVVTSDACLTTLTTPQKICELFTDFSKIVASWYGLRGRVPIVADKSYRVNAT